MGGSARIATWWPGDNDFRRSFDGHDLLSQARSFWRRVLNRVPKNRSIRFGANTNVPEPHDMYWKVRNGGEEAAAASELRGEIRKDEGQGIRVETTSYAGYHYVEVYVVKNGWVVATDRQGVIVT